MFEAAGAAAGSRFARNFRAFRCSIGAAARNRSRIRGQRRYGGRVRSAIRPILALALMLSLIGAEGAVAKPERGGAKAERGGAGAERGAKAERGTKAAFDADLRGLDTFGHGSHMAGVLAGADPETGYRGVAPGARLVSVKVAGADRITSLVRVLMALDWVRRNRNADGLRIRVLDLSADVSADGAGRVDLARTLALQTPSHETAAQPFEPAVMDLYALWADLRDEALGTAPAVGTGENGWTGRRWSGRSRSGRSWSGRSWSNSDWGAADGS
jgi:hypothetical protein